MGEAKRKAAKANDEKVIEASLLERFCLAQFFGRAGQAAANGAPIQGVAPVPENRQDQRRYDRLFEDFDLEGAEAAGVERARAGGSDSFQISDLSGDLEEYSTTLDVIEYTAKATDGKVQTQWLRPILRVVERMLGAKEGAYKAPSVKALEAAEDAPALAAVPEDKAAV